MALIKKCATCSNKGFSLKLSDGLCPDCAEELKFIERSYISALQKLSNSTYDKNEITHMIKEILLKLPKFNKMNISVKLDDCITLLSKLDKNSPTDKKEIESDEPMEVMEGEPVLVPYSSTQEMSMPTEIKAPSISEPSNQSIESLESLLASLVVDSPTEVIDEVVDIPLSNDNEVMENSLSPSEPLEEIVEDSIDSSNNLSADISNILNNTKLTNNNFDVDNNPTDITISDSNDYDSTENSNTFTKLSESNDLVDTPLSHEVADETIDEHIDSIKPLVFEEKIKEPSTPSIKDNLYLQTSKLISILKDRHSHINDLAQNLFLLKDTYMPVLKENSIFEVDDINIEKLIKDTIKILVIRTNQKEENLYDFFNYVVFAIQTNGIRTKSNDILEISALKIRYGKIVDEFYTFINPMKSIELAIQRSTGITNADIMDAPTFDEAIPDFMSFADGLKLISHNSKFMTAFLNNKYHILNGCDIPNKVGCSMDLYRTRFRDYYGEPAKAVDILHCATDILSFEEVSIINTHNSIAISTAYGTYEIYEKLKYKYK